MSAIILRDKTFVPMMPADAIAARVKELGREIAADLADRKPLVVGVLNGAFIFMADLVRAMDIECELAFIRVASYDGMSSTGKVRRLLGLDQDLTGRSVLVVEDIIDTGCTMLHLLEDLKSRGAAEVRIATLLVKPQNLAVDLRIDYCAFEIPNDFILGYGLDYDGYGRNLPDIYIYQPPQN